MKLAVGCLLLFIISCTSRPVEPTRASRHTIDTLYQSKIVLMQPELDSICRSIREERYQFIIDSLMTERKAEMNILVE